MFCIVFPLDHGMGGSISQINRIKICFLFVPLLRIGWSRDYFSGSPCRFPWRTHLSKVNCPKSRRRYCRANNVSFVKYYIDTEYVVIRILYTDTLNTNVWVLGNVRWVSLQNLLYFNIVEMYTVLSLQQDRREPLN